jgi:DHA2 family methylenomycin A resistance protein-like MFS transporter
MAAVVALPATSRVVAKLGLYLATFMAVFDIAVVYLALPAMESSIGAGLADQQWIASAYGLMEAGFTLAAGTLGDLYGRKRVYLLGIVIFLAGSVASGLAPNPGFLIAARFLQGVGGAIAMALPLAILVATAHDDADRERTIRALITIAGLGAITAPLLGGVLVHAFGWRSIFFVNVPVGLFVLYAAIAHVPESPRDVSKRLDLPGQVTSALALIAASFAAIEGNAFGWRSPAIGVAVVLALASFGAFVAIERRSPAPMLRFAVLRRPTLAASATNLLMMNLAFFQMYLIASLFLQNVRQIGALETGWYLLANNAAFFAANQFGGGIARRIGLRTASIAGLLLGAVATAIPALFDLTIPPELFAIPLGLSGLGWGFAFTPLNALAMDGVDSAETGMASGILNLGRPLGAVFGTAVFGSIVAAAMTGSLARRLVALDVDTQTRLQVGVVLHHGGLWTLPGTAQRYGLPLNTFRDTLSHGFIRGMHLSALAAGVLCFVAAVYAARTLPVTPPSDRS